MQARDPIPQFKKYCLDEGILTAEALKAIDDDVNQEVEESVTYADESPKPVRGSSIDIPPSLCVWYLMYLALSVETLHACLHMYVVCSVAITAML